MWVDIALAYDFATTSPPAVLAMLIQSFSSGFESLVVYFVVGLMLSFLSVSAFSGCLCEILSLSKLDFMIKFLS